jgi:nitronate monooxygenase
MLRMKRTRYLMRSLYALRAGLMLKRTSLDESRSDYWQAGKSVAGIEGIEPAGEIVRRLARAAAGSG